MTHLPNIARLTERLCVSPHIHSSAHDRDDVVKHKTINGTAPSAFIGLPISALKWGEVTSIAQEFSRFKNVGSSSEHHVSILGPSFKTCSGHFCASFRRLFEYSLLGAGIFWGIGTYAFADTNSRSFVVSLSPERVMFTHNSFASAFSRGASDALCSKQIGGIPVFKGSANYARNFPALSFWSAFSSHDVIANYGVNSKNNSTISVDGGGVNFEPIRACNPQGLGARQVQRLDGEDNNNLSTSAPRESDDIVWTAWRHAEVGHKQASDNTLDEVINISPNSPLSAAQF